MQAALDHPKNTLDGNVILHSIELREYVEEMRQLIASSKDTNPIENRVSKYLTIMLKKVDKTKLSLIS